MKTNLLYRLLIIILLIVLSSCGFSGQQQRDITERFKDEFAYQGYTGTIAVTHHPWDPKLGSSLSIEYVENVNGENLTFDFRYMHYTYSDYKENDLSTWFSDNPMEGIDFRIKEMAMWRQPYVKDKLNELSQVFQTNQGEFKFQEISGNFLEFIPSKEERFEKEKNVKVEQYLEEHPDARGTDALRALLYLKNPDEMSKEKLTENRDLLMRDVKANRSSHSILGGYYAIDVPKYLANHVLIMNVQFTYSFPPFKQPKNFDEYFKAFLLQYDYRQFWDGYYTFYAFDEEDTDNSRKKQLTLDIKDGKVVHIFTAFLSEPQ